MVLDHIFVISLLGFFILVNRRIGLSYLNPSVFLLFVWLAFYLMHWMIGQGMFISLDSIAVVLWLLLSFNIGEIIYLYASTGSVHYIWELKGDRLTRKRMKWFLVISIMVSLLFSLLYARIFLQYFGGISAYLTSDVRSAVVDIPVPIWVRLPLLFSYSLLLISAVYYYKFDIKRYMLLSSLPILIMGVVQNGRAGILMVVVIIFMAIILRDTIKEKKNVKRTLVKYGIGVATIGFVIFVGGAMFRYRNMETYGHTFFLDSFRSYLLGGISAFDTYIHQTDILDMGYGRYSFSALYDLLGLAKNEYGVYTEYLVYDAEGSTTNIYTAFRQMIDDFGKFGSAVYMCVLGFIGGREWSRARYGDNLAIAFMLLFYMYLFHTPLLAVTVHNSILFSFVVPSAFLVFFSKKKYLWKR